MPEPNHLTGSESVRISRSRATVIAQFEDLEHHNTHAVHDGLTWTVLEQDGQERIIRVGRKTARLFWKDEDLVLFITAGPGKGSTIYHRFKEVSSPLGPSLAGPSLGPSCFSLLGARSEIGIPTFRERQ